MSTDTPADVYGAEAVFNAQNQDRSQDNTLTIYTSAEGSEGSKVSVYKALLLSALTVGQDKSINHRFSTADNAAIGDTTSPLSFASERIEGTISLGQISVNVINQALENVAFLRAQNGGVQSRLSFNLQSLAQQKTNRKGAALGRIVDADIAEETLNCQSIKCFHGQLPRC